jgi:hypothetical protein
MIITFKSGALKEKGSVIIEYLIGSIVLITLVWGGLQAVRVPLLETHSEHYMRTLRLPH